MAEAFITQLKAMAHQARLTILRTLATGEYNVGQIEEATGIGQPQLSQQLAVLRKAHLVTTRRAAKLVFYQVNQAQISAMASNLAALGGTIHTIQAGNMVPGHAALSSAANGPSVANGGGDATSYAVSHRPALPQAEHGPQPELAAKKAARTRSTTGGAVFARIG